MKDLQFSQLNLDNSRRSAEVLQCEHAQSRFWDENVEHNQKSIVSREAVPCIDLLDHGENVSLSPSHQSNHSFHGADIALHSNRSSSSSSNRPSNYSNSSLYTTDDCESSSLSLGRASKHSISKKSADIERVSLSSNRSCKYNSITSRTSVMTSFSSGSIIETRNIIPADSNAAGVHSNAVSLTSPWDTPQENDAGSDDDAFECFMKKMRGSPKVEFSSSSSSSKSFLTNDSHESSWTSTEQGPSFYNRVDNGLKEDFSIGDEEEEEKENEEDEDSFDKLICPNTIPKVNMAPPSDRKASHHPNVNNSTVSIKPQSRPPNTPIIRQPLKQRQEAVRLDFICSLQPITPAVKVFGQRHLDAERFILQFKPNREELATRLYGIINEQVFEKRLPHDLPITWNTRLLKTAGQCKYLRRDVIPSGGEKTSTRLAEIELSPKVCSTAERVRDTLLHEICHAAVWLLDGINDGHGPRWRYWAARAHHLWPSLPMVSVCHAYEIHTRFTYRCVGCGACVNRHSKSIDMEKKVCGQCRSKFELLLNTPRGRMMRPSLAASMDKRLQSHCTPRAEKQQQQEQATTASFTCPPPEPPSTAKRRPVFAEFVKENYKEIRQKPNVRSHADTMAELGSLFKSLKVTRQQTASVDNNDS